MSHVGFFDARYLLLPAARWGSAGSLAEELQRIGWPFGPLRASVAFGPDTLPPPEGWALSASEWARIQSHARVLEDALHVRAERVLVIEDGVRFQPELGARWDTVLRDAGAGWTGMRLYGGRPELPIAYALQGRGVSRLYRALRHPTPAAGFLDRFGALRKGGVRRSGHRLGSEVAPPPADLVVLTGHAGTVRRLAAALGPLGVGFGPGDAALGRLVVDAVPERGPRMPGPELRARFALWHGEHGVEAAKAGRRLLAALPQIERVGEDLVDALGGALRWVHLGDAPPPWLPDRKVVLSPEAFIGDVEAQLQGVVEALGISPVSELADALQAWSSTA